MADTHVRLAAQRLRTGFFDQDAFRQKRRSILVLQTAVAGLCYRVDDDTPEGRAMLESLTPGVRLRLFREPDNPHDRWAIAVYTEDDVQLGYVTRFKNETIARLMDQGKAFYAVVDPPPAPSDEAKPSPRLSRAPTENPRLRSAPTEDLRLPFSIYMED